VLRTSYQLDVLVSRKNRYCWTSSVFMS